MNRLVTAQRLQSDSKTFEIYHLLLRVECELLVFFTEWLYLKRNVTKQS